jgi:hypothetical protein
MVRNAGKKMIDTTKIKSRKSQRLSSLLGMVLDGSRLDGVVLRRTNGSLQAQQPFSVSLSLDPLTADPELIGREIRNHLDNAGIRERDCVVGLPLKWALTTQIEVPAIPEEDVASFLQIEAERGFHADISTLHFAVSRSRLSSGTQQALLVGIPKTHLVRLDHVLRAAKLKPASFSLSVVALQPPLSDPAQGVLALNIGETHVALEVVAGGGVTALRALEGALETEGSKRILNAELVAREVRITLGQLPAELREAAKTIRIFGQRDLAQQLADEIELRLESLGLKVEVVSKYAASEFGLQLRPETPVSPATSLAAAHLAGRKTPFELLLPRVTAWQQFGNRYASGKMRMAGMAAAFIGLLALVGFGYQQFQLASLRSQWQTLAARDKELKGVQDQIRTYRFWYDDSIRGLTILNQLTVVFPETGIVSAKTIEIRDLNAITCTGTTQDQQSLLKVTEALRRSGNAADVKVDTIRGNKAPLQFTFNFRWIEGGRSGN